MKNRFWGILLIAIFIVYLAILFGTYKSKAAIIDKYELQIDSLKTQNQMLTDSILVRTDRMLDILEPIFVE